MTIPCEISPLKIALEAAREQTGTEIEVVPPMGETHPQGEKIGARTGIFSVMGGGPQGGDGVRELSVSFVQGENLATVPPGEGMGGTRPVA